MKKEISKVFVVAALALFGFSQSGAAFQNLAGVGGPGSCQEKIVKNGTKITVTVCQRRTSGAARFMGKKCDKLSSSQCTFTNG